MNIFSLLMGAGALKFMGKNTIQGKLSESGQLEQWLVFNPAFGLMANQSQYMWVAAPAAQFMRAGPRRRI